MIFTATIVILIKNVAAVFALVSGRETRGDAFQ